MEKRFAICGEMLRDEAKETLSGMGVETIVLKPDERLPLPVRSHADLSCALVGKYLIIRRQIYEADRKAIDAATLACGLKTVVTEEIPGDVYPKDTGLCALWNRGVLICRRHSCDGALLACAEAEKSKIINVKQGYARCSCAPLADGAVITEDAGIARTLEENGVPCLCLNGRFSSLPGYDGTNGPGGFVGGSCGLLGASLCFAGDVTLHPQYDEILKFAHEHATDVISLCGGRLTDVGSIIFLS